MAKLTEGQNIYELTLEARGNFATGQRIDKWIAAKDFNEAIEKARAFVEVSKLNFEIISLVLVGTVDTP